MELEIKKKEQKSIKFKADTGAVVHVIHVKPHHKNANTAVLTPGV